MREPAAIGRIGVGPPFVPGSTAGLTVTPWTAAAAWAATTPSTIWVTAVWMKSLRSMAVP